MRWPKRSRSDPAQPRRKRWIFEVIVLVGALFATHAYATRHAAHGQAPGIEGVGVDGAPLSLAALRGKPALVHFWATWCPVCKHEESNIAAVARDHAVLTVAERSGSAQKISAYLAAHHAPFTALADADGQLGQAWGVRAFPTSFIVDGSGQIRFVTVGYTTALGLRLRLWLAGL